MGYKPHSSTGFDKTDPGVMKLRFALIAIATLLMIGGLEQATATSKMSASPVMPISPNWRDGRFRNPQPLWNDPVGSLTSLFRSNPHGRPHDGEILVVHPDQKILADPGGSGLKVTWLGHSTVLLDLDGTRVLTDPVWSDRSSPLSWIGPKRWYAPPTPLEAMPRPDVVVISHDHYDHLDRRTIEAMQNWETRFVVPLGVGAYLRQWGISYARITELDWWQSVSVGALEITATPARHASGRGLFDKDRTLWVGYALRTPKHRVYFSGDTGLFQALSEIGTRLGPFDLTLIEIGAYGPAWPDWHLGPEQAVLAHRMVRGSRMLPIHWGLFNLAGHGWTEPAERVLAAAQSQGVKLLLPHPGEPWDPLASHDLKRWWPNIPWKSAQEVPIRATASGLRPIPQS